MQGLNTDLKLNAISIRDASGRACPYCVQALGSEPTAMDFALCMPRHTAPVRKAS